MLNQTDPAIIEYFKKQGLLPATPQPSPAAAPVAGVDNVTTAPTLVPSAPPAVPPPAPAPANPALKGPGLDWKGGLALALGGLGDALKAGGGHNTGTGVKDATRMIQEGPAKAMEAHERERSLSTEKEQDDPNSPTSLAHQNYMIKLGAKPEDVKGLSATQLQPMETLHEKVYGVDANTKERLLAADIAAQARRDVADTNASNRSLQLGEKTDQFNQREWDKILKENDPNVATSRSAIGMIGKSNINANRAITTLSKPMVTNQEAGNAMADLAAIYQGGSPTQFGMSHQQYSTIYGKVKDLLQTVTGKPQDALPDAIKKRLLSVLSDMKADNTKILKHQLDQVEKSKSKIIKAFPEDWKGFRQSIEGNFAPEAQASAGDQGAQSKIPTIASQDDYEKLASGSLYLDAQGTQRKKK